MSVPSKALIFGVGLSLLLGLSTAGAAKLYKWVDENGNVTYSDKVPPDQAKQAREELNQDGITVNRVDRAKTPEELAEVYKAEEAARQAALTAAEQKRQDQALLDSYASESDLTRAYNQRVDLLQQTIEAREVEIGLREQGMTKLVARAAETERAGRAVPDALRQMIDGERKEIDRQRSFVKDKKTELLRAKHDYDRDIARYREVLARYQKSE
ncbi:MAG: DUF4124 domain-containing protein [Xanthomonadales bacterium]|nr:DUF4124 domain-containing protein [Xanthomonadales bacterium]